MKTNEAPEKIYLCKDALIDFEELGTKRFPNDIEYTKTDAFIEKACKWLRTHSEDDYFELIPDVNYCGAGNLNKKRMIEDFRKYMEGE